MNALKPDYGLLAKISQSPAANHKLAQIQQCYLDMIYLGREKEAAQYKQEIYAELRKNRCNMEFFRLQEQP